MKWTRWTTLIVVVLIALMTVTATACSSKAANEPPSITSLLADPDAVAPGAASTVSCVAGDPDGDTLSYAWEYTGGYLQGTGSTVTWIAPSLANTYTVTVTVSDGNGGTDEDSVAISVGIVSPTPTPIPTPSPTPSDGSIDIKSGSIDGAEVIIDGVDTGMVTPYVVTHVSAGSHTVKLDLAYYKWRIGTVTVVGGETTYINWALDVAPIQLVTIQPDGTAGKDAYVYEGTPSTNYGTLDRVYVSGNAAGQQCRTYLQFNFSSIPAAAIVLNANLGLYYSTASVTAVIGPVGAYEVTGSWDEAMIAWDAQPSAQSTPLKTVAVPAAATSDFIYWDIKTLVQDWVDGSVSNNGVLLMDTDASSFEGYKLLSSSDHATGTQRPKLVIQYYDPTP